MAACEILHGIDLDIKSGEFIVFVGPSGCGKSTLLRSIAGLEDITSGTLQIAGEMVNDVPPSKRGIAMVFQSYALYPHMTVYDNMAFGMKIARESKQEIDRRVRQAADILQLTKYLERLPKALSGGQRQRVAIGRAIVRNPKVFLFDEPLSNLDAALRVATRIEIAKLKESMPNTTMIYVTHDQVEAMTLADRIVVLKDGHIEQVGSPMELYKHPGNLFVAQFIGSPAMNILPATIEKAGAQTVVVHVGGRKATVPIATPAAAAGSDVSFGVRPEDLAIATGADLPVRRPRRLRRAARRGPARLCRHRPSRPAAGRQAARHPEVKRGDTLKLDAAAERPAHLRRRGPFLRPQSARGTGCLTGGGGRSANQQPLRHGAFALDLDRPAALEAELALDPLIGLRRDLDAAGHAGRTLCARREGRSGPALAPQLWRHAARALELAAEVIDVGETAQFGDFGHRQPLLGEQGLGLQQPFADQPLPRTGAQMPPKQPAGLRMADPGDRRKVVRRPRQPDIVAHCGGHPSERRRQVAGGADDMAVDQADEFGHQQVEPEVEVRNPGGASPQTGARTRAPGCRPRQRQAWACHRQTAAGAAPPGSARPAGTRAASTGRGGRQMTVRRLVGDPDELAGLDLEPLAAGLDRAGTAETDTGCPGRGGRHAGRHSRRRRDLAGSQDAVGGRRPARRRRVVQALEKGGLLGLHARFVQNSRPVCPFRLPGSKPRLAAWIRSA